MTNLGSLSPTVNSQLPIKDQSPTGNRLPIKAQSTTVNTVRLPIKASDRLQLMRSDYHSTLTVSYS